MLPGTQRHTFTSAHAVKSATEHLTMEPKQSKILAMAFSIHQYLLHFTFSVYNEKNVAFGTVTHTLWPKSQCSFHAKSKEKEILMLY